MTEIVEKAFEELQKKLQKITIMGIAINKIGISSKNQKQVEKIGETELENIKATLSSSSKSLEHAIKGHFGKKLTEVLDKQKQTLDDF
ncbi:hypothetical protein CKN86_01835 [Carnobacterium divergens]|uniref:hypothetical protein n=1 Tax=Carnobacterium divergens TaxID=2748 RepID=UPI000D479D91|nr:hypothetical protein [Carnobacterium divergens]MCO6018347.1 hypothetical protein [Carnobacterium divergens]MPQ22018.1 hypothetical protein [Carnobacterium divergens]TFI64798.1 hypothetical protein CKN62_01835 [Carnobacterium divergens]TFI75653.1 hypothetical protein CKN81_02145 [Carnobacterium divergens]TFI91672.1 hypothetical protein CKN84_01835 [Carnobacterium divergens]